MNQIFINRNFQLLLLAVHLISLNVSGQSAPAISYQKPLGGSADEISFTTKATVDGGYIIGGLTASKDGDVAGFHGGGADLWVVKLNSSGSKVWQKSLGGGSTEKGTIVHEVKKQDGSSGGFYIGGTTFSSNGDVKGFRGGTSDIWVVKLSTTGAIQWQKPLGGGSMDEIVQLEPTQDGGCIVVGNTTSSNADVTKNHGGKDVWVVKLSATGAIQWQRALGSKGDEEVQDIDVQADGSLVVLARIYNATLDGDITKYYAGPDLWVVKVNTNGQLDWQRTLGGSGMENAFASIREVSDGGFIIGAGSDSGDGDLSGLDLANQFGFWVIKLTSTGNIEWQWSDHLGGNIWSLIELRNGGFVIAGSGDDGDPATTGAGLFVKISSTGQVVWKKEHNGGEAHILNETNDGSIISYGATQSSAVPGFHNSWAPDVWLIKIDANGDKIWNRAYGGSNEDWTRVGTGAMSNLLYLNVIEQNYTDNILDNNGNIFFTASTNSNDGDVTGLHLSRFAAKNDIWFVKMNLNGATSEMVKTSDRIETLQSRFTPLVYPNPTNSDITITFSAIQTAETFVELFDITGARIRHEKINSVQKGNLYSYKLNLKGLASGTYLYQIRNGSNIGKGSLVKTY